VLSETSHPTESGNFTGYLSHTLRAEGWAWLSTLRSPTLAGLLLALLLLLMLPPNLPLFYAIEVGREEGYGGDLPMLQGFNKAEHDEHGSYRWTTDGARIHLGGVGKRPMVVRFDVFPMSSQVAAAAPATTAVHVEGKQIVTLPTDAAGRRYQVLVPPTVHKGRPVLVLRMQPFTPPDDPRLLGTPLDRVTVMSPGPSRLALPDWIAVGRWLAVLVLLWAVVLRTLKIGAGGAQRAVWWGRWIVGGAAVLVTLAAWLDPPRWAAGAAPALLATLWSAGLVLALRPTLPRLAGRFGVPLDGQTLGWLLLITAVAFGIRLGGRLYPLSMWGDIGFHTNRFIDTLGLGKVYLLSRNRGINFPYPPGPYFSLAPLTLVGFDIRFVLPFVAALLDALSAVLVYAIAATALCGPRVRGKSDPHQRGMGHQTTALVAAALYVFTAAGIMLTWWSFDTHIYAQAASLLLISLLALLGVHASTHSPFPIAHPAVVLFLLISGVFLGHFGFLINTVLMGSGVVVLLWGLAWCRSAWARALRWPVFAAYMGAGIVALVFFYSAYLWLFESQLNAVAEGGLTGLAARAPVPRERLWHTLWEAGLIQHYGFFPLLLMPMGMWLAWTKGGAGKARRRVLVALMGCSLLVSVGFAVLPFLTLSTQNTRWLTFSAWAMAVGAALAFRWVWQNGRAGRVVVLAMAGFVLWNSVIFWIGPMLWRIRPPEPF
jgi:hypothetical protein